MGSTTRRSRPPGRCLLIDRLTRRIAGLVALALASAVAGPAEAQDPSLSGLQIASAVPGALAAARSSVTGSIAGPAAGAASRTEPPADEVLRRLGERAAEFGPLVAVHDSGFDPHTDTADFDNFGGRFLRGHCMGMAYVAKQFYLNVTWHPKGRHGPGCAIREFREALANAFRYPFKRVRLTVCGFANLREASKDPRVREALEGLARLGQMRNLSLELFRLIVPPRDFAADHARLLNYMSARQPALVAMRGSSQGGGHAVLAYKVVEYERKSLIFLYDSNAGPSHAGDITSYTAGPLDMAFVTVLVYDRATRKVSFHRHYSSVFGYDFAHIVVYEGPRWEQIDQRLRDFVTRTIPRRLRRLLPVTPMEKALRVFAGVHALFRRSLGLPF